MPAPRLRYQPVQDGDRSAGYAGHRLAGKDVRRSRGAMSLRKSLTRRDFARTVLVASAGIGGAVVLGGRASAGTGELDRYLDLEAVNANAEATGGLHPSLPSDSATLRSLVDTARASGEIGRASCRERVCQYG